MRVIAYVDGLNLYHGLREKLGRGHLWLDIERLVRSLLLPGQRFERVEYFTARVRNQPHSIHRQADYLTALTNSCPSLSIIEGRFQERTDMCRSCGTRRVAYEEKETDVNIAAAIIRDAVRHAYDMALVVSADADLMPAIRTARALGGPRRFVVAFPPRRRSDALRSAADAAFTIGDARIRAAQLPDKIALPNGVVIQRPAYWRRPRAAPSGLRSAGSAGSAGSAATGATREDGASGARGPSERRRGPEAQ